MISVGVAFGRCATTSADNTTICDEQTLTPAVARVPRRLHYPFNAMMTCVRWYVAFGMNVRHVEVTMAERCARSIIPCIVGQSGC